MHRTPALVVALALLLAPSLARAQPVCRATCEPTAGDSLSPEEARAVSASFEGILNALRSCLDSVGAGAIDPAVILRFDGNGALISKRYDLGGYENLACARDLVSQPTSVAIRRSTSLKCDSRCAASTPAPAPSATDAPRKEPRPAPKKERRRHDDDGDTSEEPVRTAKNVVFAELLGNGLAYSVNYERLFDDTGFGLRVGFSYLSVGVGGSSGSQSGSVKSTWISFPVLASYYVGSANHKLQLGLGVTLLYVASEARSSDVFGSVSGFVPLPTAAIGYRYVPAKGGFNFGIGFTPIYIPGGESRSFLPWPGIGLGAVF